MVEKDFMGYEHLSLEELQEKVMDNNLEDITEEQQVFIESVKSEELNAEENDIYQEFVEGQDMVNDFDPNYFSDINQKYHVLSKIIHLINNQ
jgi:hypothetical protein